MKTAKIRPTATVAHKDQASHEAVRVLIASPLGMVRPRLR
jgi:hypothetical protein